MVVARYCLLLSATFATAAACRTAIADSDVLKAPDDAPAFQLSNMRVEDGRFGKAMLVIDYRRTREGAGAVEISGRTPSGELSIMGVSWLHDSKGQIRLNNTFGGLRGGAFQDIEIYLTTQAGAVGKPRDKFMVSNVVRRGNPGPATRARPWNSDEKAAYEKYLISQKPPASLPGGYVAVDVRTTLLPGMPVKVGQDGEWADAEVVNEVNQALVNVALTGAEQLLRKPKSKWLAVDPDVLRRAQADPSQFSTNIRVLPGGKLRLPGDAVPLPSGIDLLVGTPLLIERFGKWSEAYVLNADVRSIRVRYEGLPEGFDNDNPRGKYLIRRETLDELTSAGAAERFASNIQSKRSSRSSASAFPTDEPIAAGRATAAAKKRKEYEIKIDVPRGAQVVPEDLVVDEGTPVAFCWAWKWQAATVLSSNDDGSLNIHWDGHSDAWDCSVLRSQLIIQDKTVRKLVRKHGKSSDDLMKTLRTWTDATGTFKVEARFVSKEGDKVTIRTDAGRDITLPLAKLSDKDQKLLAGIKPAAENPFE